MAKKNKGRVVKFPKNRTITYNTYKPNRKARRLGIKPEELPQKEEPKRVSMAAVWNKMVQQRKELESKIVPDGMTYSEYMEQLKDKKEKMEKRKEETG